LNNSVAGSAAIIDNSQPVISSKRRVAVVIGVMTGMFIAALEATIVGTAMPTVIASLGGLSHYSWVFSAYLVTSTVTVPVWGKLSDLYGRRLMYQIGIGVFLLGTALSGFSTSMGELIVFRAIQGLGAGALIPLGMTIIGDIFSVEERAKMQAYFSGVWGLSSIIGPVAGGIITDQLSWQWVFWVNVPIGVVAAVIIGLALKEPKRTSKPSVDYAGAALLMIAVSVLMLAMVDNGTNSIFAIQNLLLFIAAMALLGIFYWVETRAADPVIPFQLFKNRVIAIGVTCGFLAGVAMFGAISFVPLFAQGVLGFSATQAGSLLTPLMLSWVTMSVVGGRLMLKVSSRTITIFGFAVLTLGFVLLSFFESGWPRFWLYVDLAIVGAGLGLTMLTLLIEVQQAVARSQLGIATSLNQFSRAIGGAIGVAVMGAVLTAGLASQLRTAAVQGTNGLSLEQAAEFAADPNALIEPTAGAAISPEHLAVLRDAMETAIRPVFIIGAIMSLLSFFVSFLLPRKSGGERDSVDGERMLMAEQTTINARNQPRGIGSQAG